MDNRSFTQLHVVTTTGFLGALERVMDCATQSGSSYLRLLSIVLLTLLAACEQASIDAIDSIETPGDVLPVGYECESGESIRVTYNSDNTTVLEYDDRRIYMERAVSASCARYVSDRLEWWTKGSADAASGTLFRHLDSGNSGKAIERCAQSEDAR